MPTPDLKSFAALVRKKRLAITTSQAKLGKAVGTTNRTISDVERAVSWPEMPVVLGLCRLLDIELPKGLDK